GIMPRVKKSKFYKMLKIKSNATLFEIKHIYKKLVLVYHPDRNVNKSENEYLEAEKKFKEIQEAYEYLTTNYKESKKRKPPQQKKKILIRKKQSHKKTKKQPLKKQNQSKK
ncbi:16169_t:CDS:1, partial [Gigaspora margarita]